jgi:hypothetical protein
MILSILLLISYFFVGVITAAAYMHYLGRDMTTKECLLMIIVWPVNIIFLMVLYLLINTERH